MAEVQRVQHLLPAAMICSTLANIHRDPAKRPEAFSPADFLPHATEQPRGMTREQWIHLAKQWGAALGAPVDGN